MKQIIEAIKQSAIEIKELIETGDTSKSENENSTGDTQLKLDIASDVIIERIFKELPEVKQIVSEEQEEIIDVNEKNITNVLQKIKDEDQLTDLKILFLVEDFNFKFFQKLGFNIGDIDYLQKPIEINQLISKLNSYNHLYKLDNKFTNIDNFITQYSQSVIKGEMLGIVSHQWKQPLNIIATAIINIELKSELELIRHEDIEHCVERVHSTLGKITNMVHNFENIFKTSLLKSDFDVTQALLKSINLISPQLNSHKIKVTNNISKKVFKTINFENELCQSILCLLSILKDSIIRKYIEDSHFCGNIKLQIENKDNKIILKIINQKIKMSNESFQNSLSLNSLFISSTNDNNTKLYIAKNIIENKLSGDLSIINDTNDVVFIITI